MRLVRKQPGLNVLQVCQAVQLSRPTVRYHLKRLEMQGAVQLRRHGRDVVCVPVDVPAKYLPWLAALRNAKATAILALLDSPARAGVAEIARRLDLSESAARRHLTSLVAQGLVTKRGVRRPQYLRSQEDPSGMEDAREKGEGEEIDFKLTGDSERLP